MSTEHCLDFIFILRLSVYMSILYNSFIGVPELNSRLIFFNPSFSSFLLRLDILFLKKALVFGGKV